MRIPNLLAPLRHAFLCLFLLSTFSKGIGQNIFQDHAAMQDLQRSIDCLYNYEFDKATAAFEPIRNRYKNTIAVRLFDCLVTYWKNFPVISHPGEYQNYKESLLAAQEQSDEELNKNKKDPEQIFYNLLLNIMLARQRSEEDKKFKAAVHAYKAYAQINKGFKLQDHCPEFYFSSGLYLYYREYYPGQHPLYKPFLSLFGFPSGDKAKGLACLDTATQKAVFTRAESLMFASYIQLTYENNTSKGLYYAEMLNSSYPRNLFFKTLYVENLIQSGQYEKAIAHLDTLSRSPIPYYQLPVALFRGMLAERYYENSAEAEYWYKKAIASTPTPNSANENYIGLASYGLANIYHSEAKEEQADPYYKKACKFCHYLSIKKASCK
jgi:hypothetical protein